VRRARVDDAKMRLDTVRAGGGLCGCALQALELYKTLGAHGLVTAPCPVDISRIVLFRMF